MGIGRSPDLGLEMVGHILVSLDQGDDHVSRLHGYQQEEVGSCLGGGDGAMPQPMDGCHVIIQQGVHGFGSW